VGTKTTTPAAAPSKLPGRRISTGAVIAIANCGLGGVTAAYLSTHSVTVTLIAATAAVLLTSITAMRS
jgi:hypothetical protein